MDLQRPSDLLPIQERFVRHDRDTTFAALSCFSCSGVPYPSKSGLDKFGRLEHPACSHYSAAATAAAADSGPSSGSGR